MAWEKNIKAKCLSCQNKKQMVILYDHRGNISDHVRIYIHCGASCYNFDSLYSMTAPCAPYQYSHRLLPARIRTPNLWIWTPVLYLWNKWLPTRFKLTPDLLTTQQSHSPTAFQGIIQNISCITYLNSNSLVF